MTTMPDPSRSPRGPESLRAARRALLVLSPLVRFGLFAVGLGMVLDRTKALVSDVQLTWGERVVLGVALLAYGGGFALAGWVADRILKAAAELIGLMVDQAEASERTAMLIERQVAPSLARIALAVERLTQAPAAVGSAGDQGKSIALAGIRQAIEEARWDRADRLIAGLRRDFPDAPEADALAQEVVEGRRLTVDDLKARLEAARSVNDPDQVISYRDELTLHLRGEELKELDRQVIGWLMLLIQKRLRTGSVRPDVVGLASRVAETFGDTAEGASLRASLPTLRRSAGLCPRCSRPYVGVDDACPECLGVAPRQRIAEPPDRGDDPEEAR
ncbi:hypothetical protein [Tautonia sociabilis]|uniref:Uncharacterized protein n=1 Tax=Tautonia sociabilis TaxID=2080755 RepID=A0A432MPD0_9BACT|nr:hypothetical protein [Tautonia sociabilis]RUL88966.1 hypothetical protein TsocGM_05070 [Tautonia sociabilis]